MEEAALVDEANQFQVFIHVVIPMIRPGLFTVVIFQGMEIWNEYFVALLFITDPEKQTIPLGLAQFFSLTKSNWSLYFSALTTTIIPVIIVFMIFQKQFTEGLTAGAIKE